MVGEIYYEVVIGVSLDLLTIVFLVMVFSVGSSVWLFMEEGFYLLSFHEHVVNCGELCLFPLQLLFDGGVHDAC